MRQQTQSDATASIKKLVNSINDAVADPDDDENSQDSWVGDRIIGEHFGGVHADVPRNIGRVDEIIKELVDGGVSLSPDSLRHCVELACTKKELVLPPSTTPVVKGAHGDIGAVQPLGSPEASIEKQPTKQVPDKGLLAKCAEGSVEDAPARPKRGPAKEKNCPDSLDSSMKTPGAPTAPDGAVYRKTAEFILETVDNARQVELGSARKIGSHVLYIHYDGSFETFKSHDPRKDSSLRLICEAGCGVSKSELAICVEVAFQYGQLPEDVRDVLSKSIHVELLKIKDIELKCQLAREAADGAFTVRALRQRIRAMLEPDDGCPKDGLEGERESTLKALKRTAAVLGRMLTDEKCLTEAGTSLLQDTKFMSDLTTQLRMTEALTVHVLQLIAPETAEEENVRVKE